MQLISTRQKPHGVVMHLLKLAADELLDPEALRLAYACYRLWRRLYRPTKAPPPPPKPPPPPPPPKPPPCGCYTSIKDICNSWDMANTRRGGELEKWNIAVCPAAWTEIVIDHASRSRYVTEYHPKSGESLFMYGGLIEVFESPNRHKTEEDRQ